ncbi:hypothetical protein M885DRAFT_579423 [Pelagophyceae sp. CCMP2097]|nr:hypothetical protein M885DRAFT_579423 [Pelagophyceae sp. CCMP2097]
MADPAASREPKRSRRGAEIDFGAYKGASVLASGGAGSFYVVRIEEQLFVDVQDLVELRFGKEFRQTGKYKKYASTYFYHGPLAFTYEFGAGPDGAAQEGDDFKKVLVKMDEETVPVERLWVTCSLLRARLRRPAFGLAFEVGKSIGKSMDEGRFVPLDVAAALSARVEGSATFAARGTPAPAPVAFESVLAALVNLGVAPLQIRPYGHHLPTDVGEVRDRQSGQSFASANWDTSGAGSADVAAHYDGIARDVKAHNARIASLDDAVSEADLAVVRGLKRFSEEGGAGMILGMIRSMVTDGDSDVFNWLCLVQRDALRSAFFALLAPLVRASGMSRHLYDSVRQLDAVLDRTLAKRLGDFNGNGHVLGTMRELRKSLFDDPGNKWLYSIGRGFVADVKPTSSKPAERVCAIVLDVVMQLDRVLASKLWSFVKESLVDMINRGDEPMLLLIAMYDAAMAHKSTMRGNVKHSEFILKLLNLGILGHLEGAEILGFLVNAGDGQAIFQAVASPKGSTRDQLETLARRGVALPRAVMEDALFVDELEAALAVARARKRIAAMAAAIDDVKANSAAAILFAGEAYDAADAAVLAERYNHDAEATVWLIAEVLFWSMDQAALAPLAGFPGWSSEFNQMYNTMRSADRVVVCDKTGFVAWTAPCNKAFEHTKALLRDHGAGNIPAEYAAKGLPFMFEFVFKHDMMSFVHDTHHAFATPGRSFLTWLFEIAISMGKLAALEKALAGIGFPPRISVKKGYGGTVEIKCNLKTGKTIQLFNDHMDKLFGAVKSVLVVAERPEEAAWLEVALILHRRARLLLVVQDFAVFGVLAKTFVMATLAFNSVCAVLFGKVTPSMQILAEQAIYAIGVCLELGIPYSRLTSEMLKNRHQLRNQHLFGRHGGVDGADENQLQMLRYIVDELDFLHNRLRETLSDTPHGFAALAKKELKRLAVLAKKEHAHLGSHDADLLRAAASLGIDLDAAARPPLREDADDSMDDGEEGGDADEDDEANEDDPDGGDDEGDEDDEEEEDDEAPPDGTPTAQKPKYFPGTVKFAVVEFIYGPKSMYPLDDDDGEFEAFDVRLEIVLGKQKRVALVVAGEWGATELRLDLFSLKGWSFEPYVRSGGGAGGTDADGESDFVVFVLQLCNAGKTLSNLKGARGGFKIDASTQDSHALWRDGREAGAASITVVCCAEADLFCGNSKSTKVAALAAVDDACLSSAILAKARGAFNTTHPDLISPALQEEYADALKDVVVDFDGRPKLLIRGLPEHILCDARTPHDFSSDSSTRFTSRIAHADVERLRTSNAVAGAES